MPEGEAFEALEVVGNVPEEFPLLTQLPIFSYGDDGTHFGNHSYTIIFAFIAEWLS